ncbi:siderophore synthetase component [Allocatelliglobosispora scoriae]|uniref:Siderophore synthetase component n=1 Tax=Allocatelliglobosispora scoriae TaxID=643052 RepID=A0A841BHZ8_9ACTN|nr:IucA/IucC family C-terminal-domain containing protein [Allocatelliglobosispora scoriae]MBB5866958.1 siderophore synthetase component [Allocatelliglobosispora scoriae]
MRTPAGNAAVEAAPQFHTQASSTVAARLAGALHREGVRRFGGVEHAFDRVEVADAGVDDPVDLLPPELESGTLPAELTDAVEKLSLAYARRAIDDRAARKSGAADIFALVAGLRSDDCVVRLEKLGTEGHNLHPCGRTRLGWTMHDAMAHDLESPATTIGFVGVPVGDYVGDDLGERLGVAAPDGMRAVPVHGWQLGLVVDRYEELPMLPRLLAGSPTAALRTLWVPELGEYLKLSLDIQVTSTRRTISIASTRNGPLMSGLLPDLIEDDRVLLLAEPAGGASTLGSGRDLSVIVRSAIGELRPGELPVPGSALAAACPITGERLIALLAARSGLAPLDFVEEYARLLLPPVLRLSTRFGVGMEAHLQNCVMTFVEGRPSRLILRDLAGLRLHAGRLAASGHDFALWPGSVVGTDDDEVLLSKVAYTAFQAHLGEVILRLAEAGLDEAAAWTRVRLIVDEVFDDLGDSEHAKGDHAFLTAPTVPHKALVRMRLAGTGDLYVPVRNPLHAA